jgi:hypothetical protein
VAVAGKVVCSSGPDLAGRAIIWPCRNVAAPLCRKKSASHSACPSDRQNGSGRPRRGVTIGNCPGSVGRASMWPRQYVAAPVCGRASMWPRHYVSKVIKPCHILCTLVQRTLHSSASA